jgi:hypothetical protein
MDDGSGRTSSRLGLLRRRCFVERRLERMVRAVLDAALCMPSCDVKELSSSQNSERSKFRSKNIIERRLIY